MVSYLQYVEGSEVVDAETFATYCQQKMGIPYPSGRTMAILKKQSKVFFSKNPTASWQTFVRTVDWCLNHKRRYAEAYGVLSAARFAWRDGYLPELDPTPVVDEQLEHRIENVLKNENDEDWRYRLLTAVGVEARRRVYNAWRMERGVAGGS